MELDFIAMCDCGSVFQGWNLSRIGIEGVLRNITNSLANPFFITLTLELTAVIVAQTSV